LFTRSSYSSSQDLLRYIDEGKSPQLFLKECFDKVESSSASQQGTSAAFATFHDLLLSEIKSEWPSGAAVVGKAVDAQQPKSKS